MSSVRTHDMDNLRAPRIIATATLTVVAIAVLLLSGKSAPVSATPAAAAPSHAAADQQFPSDPAAAEQPSTDQTPMQLEPLALYQNPADPIADQISASEMPQPEPSAAVLDPTVPANLDVPLPSATKQRVFRSRRALETVDPHELLRR